MTDLSRAGKTGGPKAVGPCKQKYRCPIDLPLIFLDWYWHCTRDAIRKAIWSRHHPWKRGPYT